ncbi:glycosyltransferase [Sutcliffiella cohnii]
MKIKKVLVLSNMFPSKQSKTYGIFVENQVKALVERGLEVDVIAVTNPNSSKSNVILKYIGWFLKTFFNLIIKGKKYDIIHAHYVFPTGLLGLLYKKILGKKLIVTAHGGDIDKMAKKNEKIRKWTNQILTESDHVIAVGHELQKTIHNEFNVPLDKLSIINMGVNRNMFTPTPKMEAKIRCNIPTDSKPILFVGNIIEQKGLLELMEAFKKIKKVIPEASLYFIGSQKDKNFVEKLEKLSSTVNDVVIMEAKPQEEVALWMSAAEVFVLPSHIEGFGLVALEAMSCHTPVVGTDVGGLSYLLKDNAGILVEARNSLSLYEGILSILQSTKLQINLTQNGEQLANLYDQKNIIDQLLSVYEKEEKSRAKY